MSAYLVARFAVKDADALAAYSKKAGPVIASFGGELLFKGGADMILTGEDPLPGIAVFRFENPDKLDTFYTSAAYRALKSAREAGAEMVLSAHA